MIIQPTSAEIHVWLTFCEAISEEHLLVAYRELLNAAEKEEESRFYCPRDRHRYLVTRALVRTELSVTPQLIRRIGSSPEMPTDGPTSSICRRPMPVCHLMSRTPRGLLSWESLRAGLWGWMSRISPSATYRLILQITISLLRKSQRFMRCLITSNSIASLNIGLLRNRISKRAVWAALYRSIGSAFTFPMTMPSI